MGEANCTSEDDQRNIFAAIGPHIPDVDQSIAVLISGGMSTKSLRRAADLGVNVVGASRFRWALVYGWFAPILINTPFALSLCDVEIGVAATLQLAVFLWIPVWCLI